MLIKLLLLLALILPWLTVVFLNKNLVRRYMPVTIFTCLLMTIVFQIAYNYKWWTIDSYIVPWGYMIDISFAYGIFAVGTFWIFVLASNNFRIFLIVNLIMDAFLCFVVLGLLERLGVTTLVNIHKWQYFIVTFILSLIIYVYHLWQEKIFSEKV